MSPTQPPDGGFLDLPPRARDAEGSRVHVLPVPYEATVSYEAGTREGPRAIIEASRQVELYDAAFDSEPALSYGVHTLPALPSSFPTAEEMMEGIARAVEPAVRAGKFLLVLGGEHSISPAVVRGVRRVLSEDLTIVQIDAHADLRDSYRGSRFSHACAMRRILDENPGPAIQLGIRSFSLEEVSFIRRNRRRLEIWTAERIEDAHPLALERALTAALKGKKVYLTLDVDGLDPAVVPATGTPEPGGLSWRQARDILFTVAEEAEVVAADCVELAPRPGLHMAEYAVARLLAELLNHVMVR